MERKLQLNLGLETGIAPDLQVLVGSDAMILGINDIDLEREAWQYRLDELMYEADKGWGQRSQYLAGNIVDSPVKLKQILLCNIVRRYLQKRHILLLLDIKLLDLKDRSPDAVLYIHAYGGLKLFRDIVKELTPEERANLHVLLLTNMAGLTIEEMNRELLLAIGRDKTGALEKQFKERLKQGRQAAISNTWSELFAENVDLYGSAGLMEDRFSEVVNSFLNTAFPPES